MCTGEGCCSDLLGSNNIRFHWPSDSHRRPKRNTSALTICLRAQNMELEKILPPRSFVFVSSWTAYLISVGLKFSHKINPLTSPHNASTTFHFVTCGPISDTGSGVRYRLICVYRRSPIRLAWMISNKERTNVTITTLLAAGRNDYLIPSWLMALYSMTLVTCQFRRFLPNFSLRVWRCHGQWLDSIHLFMIKINGLVV